MQKRGTEHVSQVPLHAQRTELTGGLPENQGRPALENRPPNFMTTLTERRENHHDKSVDNTDIHTQQQSLGNYYQDGTSLIWERESMTNLANSTFGGY